MRKIAPKQYALALYEIIKGKEKPELKDSFNNFLKLVWQNKDWKNLNKILTSFEKIYNEREGIIEAEVTTAQDLSAKIKHHLEKWLAEYTKKEIILKSSVDQALLGGLVIKYNDLVLDASLNTQLNNLHQQLNQ